MIKVSIKSLVEATESGSMARFLESPKPSIASWKNRKLRAAVEKETKAYFEARQEIAKANGDLNADGKAYAIRPDKIESTTKEIEELNAQMVEIPGEPVRIADLEKAVLSENDFDRLAAFIVEEEPT